jgi:DNA-binding XRE family transcriptional regulator
MSNFLEAKGFGRSIIVFGKPYPELPACLYSQLGVECQLMGTKSRYRPKNLPRKLRQIRNALGLSQSEMLRTLGAEHLFSAARISEYETGVREPSLWVLLAYGRIARVHLESIVDDNATLPDKLPGNFNFRRSNKDYK